VSEIQFGKVNPTVRFYRSKEGYLAGVCRGLAESFELSPTLVRILWLGAVFFYGFGLGVYIILAISLPRQDQLEKAFNRRLLGVCGRLSRKMKWEVGLVRFTTVLLSLGSLGFAVLAYIVLYFSFEEESYN
jgi:phage shock protein PspC (stress-responsive transcriptional regulator)